MDFSDHSEPVEPVRQEYGDALDSLQELVYEFEQAPAGFSEDEVEEYRAAISVVRAYVFGREQTPGTEDLEALLTARYRVETLSQARQGQDLIRTEDQMIRSPAYVQMAQTVWKIEDIVSNIDRAALAPEDDKSYEDIVFSAMSSADERLLAAMVPEEGSMFRDRIGGIRDRFESYLYDWQDLRR